MFRLIFKISTFFAMFVAFMLGDYAIMLLTHGWGFLPIMLSVTGYLFIIVVIGAAIHRYWGDKIVNWYES